MESVRVRLFVGTLVGIAGGMLIAEVLPLMIWWLAIPIGGILGGSIFAAPEIRRAAPVAARFAWQSCTNLPKYWEQYRQASHQEKLAGYIVVSSLLTLATVPTVGWFLFATISRGMPLADKIPVGVLAALFTALYVFFTLEVASSPLIIEKGEGERKRIHIFLASPAGLLSALLYVIVVVGCYAALRSLRAGKHAWIIATKRLPSLWKATPKILATLWRIVGDIVKFLVRFFVELFWQVNSRPLVITAIGSALGVGMFFPLFRLTWQWEILPATVVGALTGAMLALAYYELVPKRVLKTR